MSQARCAETENGQQASASLQASHWICRGGGVGIGMDQGALCCLPLFRFCRTLKSQAAC